MCTATPNVRGLRHLTLRCRSRHRTSEGNVVREIGMNERQSSAWSEAKACLSKVDGNLFYNMPRAAINMNDGFGGGTSITNNLLINTCRESGDHGPFNSWDRRVATRGVCPLVSGSCAEECMLLELATLPGGSLCTPTTCLSPLAVPILC